MGAAESPKGGRRKRKMVSEVFHQVDGFALFLLRDEVGMKQEVLDELLGYEGKGSVSKMEHGHRALVSSEMSFYLRTLHRTYEDFLDKRALAVLHYMDRLIEDNPARAIPEIVEAKRRISTMPTERPPKEGSSRSEESPTS